MAEEIKIVASAVGFDQVQKGLNNTTTALKTTADQAQKTGQALNSSLKPGAAQAGQSLTNLGRIAQDAPFGFIAIQNNISPLIESFGRLKTETGSTGGALKSLVAGLAGPAGLGLAVSVGTALLTTFAGSLFNTKSSVTSLDSSVVILGKDIKNLGSDFTLLKDQLDLIAKNRKLDFEIQFGSGFQTNLRLAELNVTQLGYAQASAKNEFDKATAAYNSASEALNKFGQTQKGAFDSTNEFNAAVQELGDLSQVSESQLSNFNSEQKAYIMNVVNASKKVGDLGVKYYDYYNNIEIAKKQVKVLTEEEKRNNAEKLKNIETIDTVIARLQKSIADQDILARIFGTPRFDVIQKDFKLIEGAITTLVEKFNINPSDNRLLKLQIQISNLESALKPAEILKFATKTKAEIEKGFQQLKGVKILPEISLEGGVKNIKNLENLTESIGAFFENAAVDIATNFGETLGQVISGTATFGDFFSGLFNVLGKAVQSLGQELIKIGAAAIVAKLALDQVLANPFAAIAAGVALVALGSLISQATNRQRFAVGTRNAPGGMALVGERGPELVNLPRGSQVIPAAQTSQMMGGVGNSIQVYGVLRGQDIFFSNKKYGQTYGRTT